MVSAIKQAGYLSWLESGASNTKILGSIPILARKKDYLDLRLSIKTNVKELQEYILSPILTLKLYTNEKYFLLCSVFTLLCILNSVISGVQKKL